MEQQYFKKDYLNFFKKLAVNNNKDWFDANKKVYQTHVKLPFETFVAALIESLKVEYKLGELKPSECIFRINKDVRFSKDKTPYKLQMSALINRGGKKNMHSPGLYISLGPEFLSIYTGFYMPEKEQLLDIRKKIAANPKKFNSIIQSKEFIKVFSEVKGEKSKILPAEVKPLAAKHEFVFNKQYYLVHEKDAEICLNSDVKDYVINAFEIAKDFNSFLS